MSKKFPVLEVFTSIQGEGKWTGEPSVFVRVAGCNLRCVFGNSRCDTPYSSFELEKPITDTVEGAIELVKAELEKTNNVDAAAYLGTVIAKRALEKGITTVVFDRGGFIYQGKIKALADAAREAGLEF